MTKQNSGDYILPNNDGLDMLLTANNSGLTYHILAVRWSLSEDAYRHIGSVEGGGGSAVTIANAFPSSPSEGQQHVNNSNGREYVANENGSWVQTGGPGVVSSSSTGVFGAFTVTESGGNLLISNGSNTLFRMDADGNLEIRGTITASTTALQ